MRYFLLLILWSFTISGSLAQKNTWDGIPEFIKIPEANRSDSISLWYNITAQQNNNDTSIILGKLRAAMEYAEFTRDPVTKEALMYVTGHFYREVIRDSATASAYINEALALDEKYNLRYQLATHMHDIGISYYNLKNNEVKCLEQLLIADEMYTELNLIETNPNAAIYHYYELGFFYYHLGNYRAVVKLYTTYLNYADRYEAIYQIQMLNTTGLSYREMNMPDSALFYFRKTLELAHQLKSKTWAGIASGNIGYIHFKKQLYDSALVYIQLNYDYVKNAPEVSGIAKAEALLPLAEVNMAFHKPDLVLTQLSEAEKLINERQIYRTYGNGLILMLKIYYLRSRAYTEKQDFSNANFFLRKASMLKDTLNNKANVSLYTQVQVHKEAERNVARIKKVKTDSAFAVQGRNFSLIALVLAGLILFSLYKRQQLKNKKDKEIFDSKEQLLYLEKIRSEEQLISHLKSLQEKNRLIEDFQMEIERLNSQPRDSKNQQSIETLEKLQQFTLITDEDWQQFKTLFENVHKGFFVRVKQKYPDITPAEMRLLALVKLRVPRKQMAGMLGISTESIRKTSWRFLKKISVAGEQEPDLSEIVASL